MSLESGKIKLKDLHLSNSFLSWTPVMHGHAYDGALNVCNYIMLYVPGEEVCMANKLRSNVSFRTMCNVCVCLVFHLWV